MERSNYTRSEAADIIGVDKQTISNYISAGILVTTGNAKGCTTITGTSLHQFLNHRDDIEAIEREIGRYILLRKQTLEQSKQLYQQAMNEKEGMELFVQWRKNAPLFRSLLFETWTTLLGEPSGVCRRNVDIIRLVLQEGSYQQAAKLFGLSQERVRQCVLKNLKAFAKMHSVHRMTQQNKELSHRVKSLEQENSELRYKLELMAQNAREEEDFSDANPDRMALLNDPISEVLPDLSVRLQRALQCASIENLMTIVRMNKASLLRIRNLGKKCATELMDALEGLGLKLDMSNKEIYHYVNGR